MKHSIIIFLVNTCCQMLVIDITDESFCIYEATPTGELHKRRFFGDITSVADQALFTPPAVLLLDEHQCLIRTYTIFLTCDQPFSIAEYKKILQEKQEDFYATTKARLGTLHTILYADGKRDNEALQSLLGRTGTICFHVYAYAPRVDVTLHLERIRGDCRYRATQRLQLFPRYALLLRRLDAQLHREKFLFMHIDETNTMICRVQHGRPEEIQYAPIGQNTLVAAVEEQEVQKYLYDSFDQIERNPIVKKLLGEAMSFFTQQLTRVISDKIEGQVVVISGTSIHHPLFMELFQKEVSTMSRSFVMPFGPTHLSEIQHQRTPTELAVRAYYAHMLETPLER